MLVISPHIFVKKSRTASFLWKKLKRALAEALKTRLRFWRKAEWDGSNSTCYVPLNQGGLLAIFQMRSYDIGKSRWVWDTWVRVTVLERGIVLLLDYDLLLVQGDTHRHVLSLPNLNIIPDCWNLSHLETMTYLNLRTYGMLCNTYTKRSDWNSSSMVRRHMFWYWLCDIIAGA